MDIQAIITKKLNAYYAPSFNPTIGTGDDMASQANWSEGIRLPR